MIVILDCSYIYIKWNKIVKLKSSNQHRGTCKIDQQLNEVLSAEFNNTIEHAVHLAKKETQPN